MIWETGEKNNGENGRDHFKGHALVSEAIARDVMQRLKFDNDTIKKSDASRMFS